MKPKITFIIVTYNSQNLIENCLNSLKSSHPFQTIVVDNDSQDGTLSIVSKFKWVEIIKSDKNLGFSKGNNLARSRAQGQYLWFLNPDTVMGENTIDFMINYLDAHPDIGVATPKLVLPDGSFDKNCHRAFPSVWNSLSHFLGLDQVFPNSRLFAGYYLGHLPEDKEAEVDVVGGSSLLVRKNLAEEIGWWDEDYFMYGEDIDFTYRIKQLGHKIMYVPNKTITHYHGASSGLKTSSSSVTTATSETKLRSKKATTNAMRIFYKKHLSHKHSPVISSLVDAGISLLELIRNLKK